MQTATDFHVFDTTLRDGAQVVTSRAGAAALRDLML